MSLHSAHKHMKCSVAEQSLHSAHTHIKCSVAEPAGTLGAREIITIVVLIKLGSGVLMVLTGQLGRSVALSLHRPVGETEACGQAGQQSKPL